MPLPPPRRKKISPPPSTPRRISSPSSRGTRMIAGIVREGGRCPRRGSLPEGSRDSDGSRLRRPLAYYGAGADRTAIGGGQKSPPMRRQPVFRPEAWGVAKAAPQVGTDGPKGPTRHRAGRRRRAVRLQNIGGLASGVPLSVPAGDGRLKTAPGLRGGTGARRATGRFCAAFRA